MDYDNAKRLKSSSGSPISVNRPTAGATALPQYQPPPARGSPSNQPPTASVSRTPPPSGKNSLKLTVKAAPSKLRQAISGSQLPPNPYADEASESDATPKPSARTARATRNPRTVVEQDSDDDDDDDDDDEDVEGEDDDEDADGEEVDDEILANEDGQEDAEGEDEDMDDLQDSHPPPPVIKQQKVPGKAKPNVTVSAPSAGPLKSVEAKELEDADDDELSDLESGDEMELGGEGEEEDEIGDEDDDLSGSDDGSRSATPDITKLTRRQRGVFEEENVGLLALSNEAQKKKMLSVEEHAMRRQEMARRRKNLSEKRNEEEKMETINKLLSKPAPKRRTRAEMIAAQLAADMTPGAEDEDGGPRANPLFSRWVNNKSGSLVAVPDEWLESPLGDTFRVSQPATGAGKMVEEVA